MVRQIETLWMAFLFFPILTIQVDVEFSYETIQTQYCHNLRPGQCCVSVELTTDFSNDAPPRSCLFGLPRLLRRSRSPQVVLVNYPGFVTIRNLLANEVAFVWGYLLFNDVVNDLLRRGGSNIDPRNGCFGRPIETIAGPQNFFEIDAWDNPLTN